MAVKREEVEAKAKELGISLTEEQIIAHVALGSLPVKESVKAPDDDDDDDDDTDLTAGMKKRLGKVAQQRKEAREEAAELRKKLKDIEDAEEKTKAEKLKAEGRVSEALDDATSKLAAATAALTAARETVKEKAIKGEITTALMAAGLLSGVEEGKRADRIKKALRLFDTEDVHFEFKGDDSFEYDMDDIGELVKAFKAENDFLFLGEGGDDDDAGGQNKFSSPKPGKAPKNETPDKRRERLIAAGVRFGD